MIVVWLGDSVNEYRAHSLKIMARLTLICPICGEYCHYHGWYSRKVRTDDDVVYIKIARVRCKNCKKTHIVLPDFLSPHKHYTQQTREITLQACLEEDVPVEDATNGNRAVATTRRWLREFRAKFTELVGALMSIRVQLSSWNATTVYRKHSQSTSTLQVLCEQICRLLGNQICHSSILGLANQIISIGGLQIWC